MGSVLTSLVASPRRRIPLLMLAIALLAAACARQPAQPSGPERAELWNTHQTRLARMQTWELRGRIAVRLEKDAWSATLHWRETPDGYRVRVMAPLGRGTFELSGAAGGVELRTADNRLLRAADPEALVRENLGWQLPVSGLRWWVRGLPRPGADPGHFDVNAEGRLDELIQDGWRVNYEDYRSQGGLVLPATMSLENGAVRVRIVVNEWLVVS